MGVGLTDAGRLRTDPLTFCQTRTPRNRKGRLSQQTTLRDFLVEILNGILGFNFRPTLVAKLSSRRQFGLALYAFLLLLLRSALAAKLGAGRHLCATFDAISFGGIAGRLAWLLIHGVCHCARHGITDCESSA